MEVANLDEPGRRGAVTIRLGHKQSGKKMLKKRCREREYVTSLKRIYHGLRRGRSEKIKPNTRNEELCRRPKRETSKLDTSTW